MEQSNQSKVNFIIIDHRIKALLKNNFKLTLARSDEDPTILSIGFLNYVDTMVWIPSLYLEDFLKAYSSFIQFVDENICKFTETFHIYEFKENSAREHDRMYNEYMKHIYHFESINGPLAQYFMNKFLNIPGEL